MTELLLQPVSVNNLISLVLYLVVLGYLLSVRGKSRATWWLAAAFAGLLLFSLSNFLRTTLYASPSWLMRVQGLMFFTGTGVFLWSYLHFAYRFLENPFRREARVALWVTGGLLAVDLGHAAYVIFGPGQTDPGLYHAPLCLAFLVWATVVLVRKWRRAARQADAEQQHRSHRAYRAYALLNGFGIVFLVLVVLNNVTGTSPEAGGLFLLTMLSVLGFFFGIVVVYLNHAPEPTSMQVKLIGLSLVTVLALLVVVLQVVYPGFDVEGALVAAPEREALRFAPDGNGGYGASAQPMRYDGNGLGENLAMADDTARAVALGFDFPYAGRRWDSLYVSPNGAVTFGAPIYETERISFGTRYFYNSLPKIAPLYIDLDPTAGGGVYLQRDSARATITWRGVPRWSTEDRNSLQLVLHADGAIDFVYGDVAASMAPGVRGLHPGGEVQPQAASLAEGLPARIAPGAARIEDFEFGYRRAAHSEVKKLVWLVLGGALFVLVVFPFFFRSSLVKPLRRLLAGVRRVNDGKLDEEVPVGVRDEIGTLATNFNRMTQSLRRYSEAMEERVAERTAKLEASLDELRAAQAQLVQQEKMASLGELTAGIAHEIKNPLNFVNNFAGLSRELSDELSEDLETLDGRADTERVEEMGAVLRDLKLNASKIEEHGKRADGIVKSMLLHSRGTPGERQETDLNALLDEYVDLAYDGMRARHADFNATIERDYGDAVGEVKVVPQELGRVFINLFNNAFDAVHAKAAKLDGEFAPRVTVSTRHVGGEVEIRIEDNGPGIPAAVREQIFEPFFTTKPTGAGTGLGLSMSYDIVAQGHGGTLAVESAEGEGAAFVVRLPQGASAPAHG